MTLLSQLQMNSSSALHTIQHLLSPFTLWLAHLFSGLGGFTFYFIAIPFLYWTVNRRFVHQLAVTLVSAIWLSTFVKDMVAFARPTAGADVGVFVHNTANGFVSGESVTAVVFWGMLWAYVSRRALSVRRRPLPVSRGPLPTNTQEDIRTSAIENVKGKRRFTLTLSIVAPLLILLIAFSRLLLGANYVGDVIFGLVLGLLFVIVAAFVYRRGNGSGQTRGRTTRIVWSVAVPSILMLLDPSPTAYAALGLLMGLLVTDEFALTRIDYQESAPVKTQVSRLAIGYAGLAILMVLVTRFVPEGIPEFLAFALVSGWLTVGAPLLFCKWGLSGIVSGHARSLKPLAFTGATTAVVVIVMTLVALPSIPAHHETTPAFADADAITAIKNPMPTFMDGLNIAHQTPDGRPFAVIGHKGSAATAPEETLPSFQLAMKLGVDFLDLDLRMTKDHHFVLLHDDTVDATTNGHGAVEDMTLAQVEALDAGYWFTPDGGKTYPYRGKGIHLLTIDKFLQTFPNQQINIEMKNPAAVAGQELAKVIAANHAQNRVIVGSFWDPPLDTFRQQMPDVRSMITQAEVLDAFLMAHFGLEAYWHPSGSFAEIPETRGPLRVVTPGFIQFLHEHGVAVIVWTVDDKPSMQRLIQMGVDGIISDNPALLLTTVKPQANAKP